MHESDLVVNFRGGLPISTIFFQFCPFPDLLTQHTFVLIKQTKNEVI